MTRESGPLPARDLKLLREILAIGHELEKLWPNQNDSLQGTTELLALLGKLKHAIELCEKAESPDLSRLAFHVRDLTLNMSARHLGAVLVPFERLHSRAIRDDEFMVKENDLSLETTIVTAPLIVIADNIRSAFNVGAILRTAECFAVEEVVLSGYTPTPEDDKTARTSMGAESLVKWRHAPNAREAIDSAKKQGYSIVALETVESAIDLDDFEWPEKVALILGNERFGVDHDLLSKADHLVRIPLHGRKNSLNVGIAFGISVASWRSAVDWRNAIDRRSAVDRQTLRLNPVGTFHASTQHPYEARRQSTEDNSGGIGYVELYSGFQPEQVLHSLEGFDRIWLLYGFHHNTHWRPMVMPPRGPRIKRGVFATRSPYRPNPLGLSAVELVSVEGRKIFVRGFDVLDGSPIYDVKPYLPYADSFPEAKTGWLENIDTHKFEVKFSPTAEQQLEWLESNGVPHIRGFLQAQLSFDPLDSDRKRVTTLTRSLAKSIAEKDLHRLAYRTWRADFSIAESTIEVLSLTTGYSPADLNAVEDRYNDKILHRAFLDHWPR